MNAVVHGRVSSVSMKGSCIMNLGTLGLLNTGSALVANASAALINVISLLGML
jgi:hypothetical protein